MKSTKRSKFDSPNRVRGEEKEKEKKIVLKNVYCCSVIFWILFLFFIVDRSVCPEWIYRNHITKINKDWANRQCDSWQRCQIVYFVVVNRHFLWSRRSGVYTNSGNFLDLIHLLFRFFHVLNSESLESTTTTAMLLSLNSDAYDFNCSVHCCVFICWLVGSFVLFFIHFSVNRTRIRFFNLNSMDWVTFVS